MNITQILILYIKKTQKDLFFSFSCLRHMSLYLLTSMVLFAELDQLQAAHLTWSGRGWWAQEGGRGGTRSYLSTGRINGYDCSSCCGERTSRWGMVQSFLLLLSLLWDLLPDGNPKVIYFWGGNDALLLLVLPWAPCCIAREYTVVPRLPSPQEHGAWCPPWSERIPAQSHFWHPPIHGQCHHSWQKCWWAVPLQEG